MLLKNLSLETFVKNIRSTILSKKYQKNSVAKNNRTKMMLRKLLLEMLSKICAAKSCREKN